MGFRGILGVGLCVVAAIYNLSSGPTATGHGGGSTAAIWLILAVIIVACSRWLRSRKTESTDEV